MGNLANIVLNNGVATPVAHTFEPAGRDVNGVPQFNDKLLGVALAYPQLSLSLRRPTKTNRNYKVMGKIIVPTLEAATGVNSQGFTPPAAIAYATMGVFEFVIPERSTLAERKDVLAYVKNALANALIASMVTDYVDLY